MCAMAVTQKGADAPVIDRIARFIKDAGIHKCAYKSDQERPLVYALEKAFQKAGRTLKVEEALSVVPPEHSSVGESASNGYAERGVQLFEDLLRTWKLAFEIRLGAPLPVHHPLVPWLIEHVANLLNKYVVGPGGKTPYSRLHGKEVDEEMVEF